MIERYFAVFVVGAIAGSIITYLIVTFEKRMVSRVRSRIETLGDYHGLNSAQYKTIHSKQMASDGEILAYYNWAKSLPRGRAYHRINRISMAAEGVICEKLFGLTIVDAMYIGVAKSETELRERLNMKIKEKATRDSMA
jgi:hypothetical protein